jgi:hypothetical protein
MPTDALDTWANTKPTTTPTDPLAGWAATPPATAEQPTQKPSVPGHPWLDTPKPDYGEIRAPTLEEKIAQGWETATHGLFSAGPKMAPSHVEGVKTEWGDLPHIAGGMVAEMLLNPGNMLAGAFGGVAGATAQKAIGKAFSTYMLAQTVKAAPGLYQEAENPDVSGAQKTADIGAAAGQALLGGLLWHGPFAPHVETGVAAFGNALRAMKPEDAGRILAQANRGTPAEVAELLTNEIANQKDPDVVEHLTAAAQQFRDLDRMQPEAVKKANDLHKAFTEIQRVFAPVTLGPNAQITAGSLREMGGELAQRTDRAAAALEASSKALMKLDPEYRWIAVDRIERGLPQRTPELQAFADATRKIFDTKRDEIQALGTGKLDHYIDDYFVHLWKDPEEATTAFQKAVSKAPIQGNKSFLKQRTIPTIAEGRALGLEPVSSNPVDLVLLGARQMDKYIVGQKWMQEMKNKGLAKPFASPSDAPPGWVPIDDPIATIYGPRKGAVSFGPDVNTLTVTPEDVTVHGQRIMGKYYAPEEVAAVANNHLSPGLRKYATYRAYMSAANTLNQFQLGLSAFHLGFTSVDTSISKLSVALEYASQGKLGKAAGKVAQVPIAPVANLLQGDKVLREWLRPGSQGDEIAKVADAIRMAGGRAQMDQLYKTEATTNMMNAFREGRKASAIWHAPFAALEQVSKPLMEYIVPRQKLGVAADMMRMEMDRMPKDATPEMMRERFGKVWDSVDNRMGQMVYDNLFWNKTLKDLTMASVRSVGWDVGTVRELGGGMTDSARFMKDLMTPGEKAKFTHRMAYMIALPMMTGFLGATYQYLKTGKGPEELRDVFFPKTGEKDPQGRDVRMAPPTYMKDVYSYGARPVQTIEGKANPFPLMVKQMLENQDYYGKDIRNKDDPLVKQMMEDAEYMFKTLKPIGIRQEEISDAAGQSLQERAGNFVGFTRAPAWVGETDAEQLASKLAGDTFKQGGTPDEALVQKKMAIKGILRNGTEAQKANANKQLDDMEDAQQITPAARKNLEKGIDNSYLENAVSHLEAKEAMRVFKVASPQEREVLADSIQRKIDKAKALSDGDRQKLQDEFDKLTVKRDPSHSNR